MYSLVFETPWCGESSRYNLDLTLKGAHNVPSGL